MAETASPTRFPIEAIAVTPGPGLKAPHSFSFSQDDQQVTYLLAAGEQAIQQLYALNTTTGESSVLVAPPAPAPACHWPDPVQPRQTRRATAHSGGR
jgi:hypothetical protein